MLDYCKLMDFPIIQSAKGNLTVIEGNNHIPFDIKRIYYLYDIPGGAERAGHAHKKLHQIIIAISGSFDIEFDDGISKKKYHLNRSYFGVYSYPMIWRVINNFSSGSVCLVLASDIYDELDYYRDYQDFLNVTKIK